MATKEDIQKLVDTGQIRPDQAEPLAKEMGVDWGDIAAAAFVPGYAMTPGAMYKGAKVVGGLVGSAAEMAKAGIESAMQNPTVRTAATKLNPMGQIMGDIAPASAAPPPEPAAQQQTTAADLALAAPMATPGQPPAGGQGAPGVRLPGTYGLGRIQRGVRQAGEEYQTAKGELVREGRDIIERQKDAALEQADAQRRAAMERATALGAQYDEQLALQGHIAERKAHYDQMIADDEQKLADAREDAKYWNITPEQRRKYQEVLADPNRSPEDKRVAQAGLMKGSEIDVNRVFGGSTGRQIMAVIAQAMGAFGSALTGGPNAAAQIINNAIDRDLQAQLEKRRDKKQLVEVSQNAIDQNLRRFGNEQQAAAATAAMQLQGVQTYLESVAAKHQGDEMGAAAQQLIAELDGKRNEYEGKVLDEAHSKAIQTLGTEAQIAGQRNAQAMQRAALMAKGPSGKPVPRIAGMVPTGDADVTEQDAKTVKAGRTSVQKALAALDAMEAHVNEYGREFFSTDAAKQGKRMARDFQLALKSPEFYQLGVLAGPDMDLLEQTFPSDITQMRQGEVRQAIEFWRNKIRDGWAITARNRGYQDTEIGAQQSVGSFQPH